jgi:hypothetical protein
MWASYPFAVTAFIGRGNYRDVWLFACVLLVITGIFRRIGTSRIVLLSDRLIIENPLALREIHYSSVREVRVTSGGGVMVSTVHGDSASSFAFGGSPVDRFFRTSEKAAGDLQSRLPKGQAASKSSPVIGKVWRQFCLSDISFALALTCGFVGFFSSSR